MERETIDPSRLMNYSVIDTNWERVGSIRAVWVDDVTEAVKFLGVNVHWLSSKQWVFPVQGVEISDETRSVRLPWTVEKVRDAPSFDWEQPLTPEMEKAVYAYYGLLPTSDSASRLSMEAGSPVAAMNPDNVAGAAVLDPNPVPAENPQPEWRVQPVVNLPPHAEPPPTDWTTPEPPGGVSETSLEGSGG